MAQHMPGSNASLLFLHVNLPKCNLHLPGRFEHYQQRWQVSLSWVLCLAVAGLTACLCASAHRSPCSHALA